MRETVVICSYTDENIDIAEIIQSSFCLFLRKELQNFGLVAIGDHRV